MNVFVEIHTGVCPQMVSQWSLSSCSIVKNLKLEITDYTFRIWFMQERRCGTQSADPHSEEAMVLPQKSAMRVRAYILSKQDFQSIRL